MAEEFYKKSHMQMAVTVPPEDISDPDTFEIEDSLSDCTIYTEREFARSQKKQQGEIFKACRGIKSQQKFQEQISREILNINARMDTMQAQIDHIAQ